MGIFTGQCLNQPYIPLNESHSFAQDAVDLVEFANGVSIYIHTHTHTLIYIYMYMYMYILFIYFIYFLILMFQITCIVTDVPRTLIYHLVYRPYLHRTLVLLPLIFIVPWYYYPPIIPWYYYPSSYPGTITLLSCPGTITLLL